MYRVLLCTVFLSPVALAADKAPAAKPLNVLVISDIGVREMQFCRGLFQRETDQGRARLSVYLQQHPRAGLIPGGDEEQWLERFPSTLTAVDLTKKETTRDNLGWYDLVIACDPNWDALGKANLGRLRDWVREHGGGLVVVAWSQQFHRLHAAREKDRERIQPVLDLLPVIPGPAEERAGEQERRLHFTPAARDVAFLRLGSAREPLSGWETFFQGTKEEGQKEADKRGFYSCHPLRGVKKGATVLATFDNKVKTPFLVTMKQGKGRVVYLGSGETWRLRMADDQYHERFWRALARDAAAGRR